MPGSPKNSTLQTGINNSGKQQKTERFSLKLCSLNNYLYFCGRIKELRRGHKSPSLLNLR